MDGRENQAYAFFLIASSFFLGCGAVAAFAELLAFGW